jgi:HEAT repeat protein
MEVSAAGKQGTLALVLLLTALPTQPAWARDEWFRGLDLEAAVARSDLVIVARVDEVSERKIIHGGKSEQVSQQFKFAPVRTLKGIFARDALWLTTSDLGSFDDRVQLERGQIRVLFLGRSQVGYANQNEQPDLDQSLPPLRGENDPLRSAVDGLVSVTQQHDRSKKAVLLLEGLRMAKGASAVPLLIALQRQALLAAQLPPTAEVVNGHLDDASAAVREAAARTLKALLDADYLEHRNLRASALTALTAALRKKDGSLGARVAALETLGSAGAPALENEAAVQQLQLNRPQDTFAERAALLAAIGQIKMVGQRDPVAAFLQQLPLDAPANLPRLAGTTLIRLDAGRALKVLLARLQKEHSTGLGVATEIGLLGELPVAAAVPALLDVNKLDLNHSEKVVFATASEKVADPRLVRVLAGMLDPRRSDLRWHAVEALRKINTAEAAEALQPHLKDEADLMRKLQIAEFLGRYGIRDGYPYAIEHMSEPHLLEQAVAALAAIREPKAEEALRTILKTSNDITWNSAAIRALGALGVKDVAPQLLDIVQDLRRPLAPAALIALGDLGEQKALPRVREALASRNERLAAASARAAGKLLARTDAKTDDVRDQLAALVADADAAQHVRSAALDALLALKDARLDHALAEAVRDVGLEGSALLAHVDKLVRERKVRLTAP